MIALAIANVILLTIAVVTAQQNKDLKRRMRYLILAQKVKPVADPKGLAPPPRSTDSTQRGDVQLALVGLGYSKAVAKAAVADAARFVDENDFEALLRKALQMKGAV